MLAACRSAFLVLASLFLFLPSAPQTPPADPKAEIFAFNEKFINAHLRMDDPAIIAMWAEDGVSLLPSMAPLVGRAAIGKFINDISAQMPGYKIIREKIDFHDIQVSGNWASEWGIETQGLQPPNQPSMEGYGKILFVLHK
ncbi:MAG TPA: nuclear transport factor 2 family protein, partial [Candidatus Acidoferrum sp.]|nr:nuclear transport factor 2 family protein [Candidatus Acidoferrum sp.]